MNESVDMAGPDPDPWAHAYGRRLGKRDWLPDIMLWLIMADLGAIVAIAALIAGWRLLP